MNFDYQPILKGQLVEVRPLRPDDRDGLYAVAADPDIWKQHPAKNRHEKPEFETFFRDALASGGAVAVVDAKTGQIVGSSRFYGFDEGKSEVEIGWTFLARSYWGGVYNGELKQLMLGHAFQFARRAIFLIDPENLRSQRSVEKLGAIRAGWGCDGSGRDVYRYEIDEASFTRGVATI